MRSVIDLMKRIADSPLIAPETQHKANALAIELEYGPGACEAIDHLHRIFEGDPGPRP